MALSNRDQVRLLVGDTDASDQLLLDTEIDQFLADRTLTGEDPDAVNVVAAAADAAGAICARFARGFTFGEDGQFFNRSERVEHYRRLESDLRRRSGGTSVPLTTTGADS